MLMVYANSLIMFIMFAVSEAHTADPLFLILKKFPDPPTPHIPAPQHVKQGSSPGVSGQQHKAQCLFCDLAILEPNTLRLLTDHSADPQLVQHSHVICLFVSLDVFRKWQ